MKRAVLLGVVILGFAADGALAQTSTLHDIGGGLAVPSSPTVIFTARESVATDPKKPRAEAIAVKENKLVAVGTGAEVTAAAGKDARLDKTFNDKVVTAGFVEQHVHPLLAALRTSTKVISIEDWDAIDGFSPAVRDPKGYQQRLLKAISDFKAANESDKSTPHITWGYHYDMHGPQMSRAKLDKRVPDFPAIVWRRSQHEFFLNDAALKATGIDKACIDAMPKSARDQANWEKGHFYEQSAIALLTEIAPLTTTPEETRHE